MRFLLFLILFLVFEPQGLVGIWRRVRDWFLLWPFKQRSLAGGRLALRVAQGELRAVRAVELDEVVAEDRETGTPFDIRAGKRRDEYSGLMRLAQTMPLPAAQLAVEACRTNELPIFEAIGAAVPSTIAASTTWPSPLTRDSRRAASTPMTRYVDPPPKSPTRLLGKCGRSGDWPRPWSTPAIAM